METFLYWEKVYWVVSPGTSAAKEIGTGYGESSTVVGGETIYVLEREKLKAYSVSSCKSMMKACRKAKDKAVLVSVRASFLHAICASGLMSEMYNINEDRWRTVPSPAVRKMDPRAKAEVLQDRYIYLICSYRTIERLDYLDQERGWESLEIVAPKYLEGQIWSTDTILAFVSNTAELMFATYDETIVVEETKDGKKCRTRRASAGLTRGPTTSCALWATATSMDISHITRRGLPIWKFPITEATIRVSDNFLAI
ncbi:MAG: hypothetical protein P4L51_20080 [Puia sp.]|nr:hypothetical protein [Puia sp.]